MSRLITCVCLVIMISAFRCHKDGDFQVDPEWRYFEVGIKNANPENWRDSSFVVATKNAALLQKIEAQLALPVADRNKIVAGKLASGNGGYNKNGNHNFKWRIQEDDWDLVDLTIELSDGRPYSDVDVNNSYWMNSVKRYTPWGSYIKKEIVK
jgi:hypothetical protein